MHKALTEQPTWMQSQCLVRWWLHGGRNAAAPVERRLHLWVPENEAGLSCGAGPWTHRSERRLFLTASPAFWSKPRPPISMETWWCWYSFIPKYLSWRWKYGFPHITLSVRFSVVLQPFLNKVCVEFVPPDLKSRDWNRRILLNWFGVFLGFLVGCCDAP